MQVVYAEMGARQDDGATGEVRPACEVHILLGLNGR